MSNSSKSIFDIFGEACTAEISDTERAGRYPEQAEGERAAIIDVIEKLKISPSDSLLEIGSGPGNLLIPISFLVVRATAMDNCGAMERLKARFTATNVDYVVGSFPDMRPIRMYSKILIYSVLHCLSSLDQVKEFVFAALEFLEPGGRMLLGDLPNSDLKARFLNSDSGRIFDAEWQASRKPLGRAASEFQSRAAEIGCLGTFDDNFLVSLLCMIRSKGYSTYLVPQKPLMPFGNTREDIIIAK